MKHHIMFLNLPAFGHVLPTLGLVAELVDRGHRVTYATTERLAGTVAATGAEVLRYESPWSQSASGQRPPEPEAEPGSAKAAERALAKEWAGRSIADAVAFFPLVFLEETKATLPEFERHLGEDLPDLLVYDDNTYLTAQVLARKWDRPVVSTSAYLASNESFSVEREIAGFIGTPDPANPASEMFRSRLAELFAEQGIGDPPSDGLHRVGPGDLRLVFVPREFQPRGDTFDEQHLFVGPCSRTAHEAQWQPPASGHPVVLVSLGTEFNDRPDFFRMCADAFTGLPWHLVMAVGPRFDPATLGEVPDNVEVHQWLPFSAVLGHTTVVVCQAGLGTVMESLAVGAPVVGVPQSPEQAITARRLVELGLGHVMSNEELSAERLRDAVVSAASDENIRSAVDALKSAIAAGGGYVRAADAIERKLRS